ncbi:MAG: primosomal protein N' [Methylococcaceae bacterium]|nr:primosomal protein N' [Methylococcaceae bacterium]
MPAILKVAVPVPLRLVFDYLPPPSVPLQNLIPGQRITVPFGPRTRTGYLLAILDDTDIDATKLKQAIAVLDDKPLQSPSDLKLLIWASRYYHHPIGEVCAAAFPVLLRKGRPATNSVDKRLVLAAPIETIRSQITARAHRQHALIDLLADHPEGLSEQQMNRLGRDWRTIARLLLKRRLIETKICIEAKQPDLRVATPDFDLNREQQHAVETIHAGLGGFQIFLLEGITGSGKTEVYFRIIQSVLAAGRQVMVLLPEITLTPQLESRFKARFNIPIAIFHSGMTEEMRKNSWLGTVRGHNPILLGTRSAVFTPLKAPGLIILDEEHDVSFKQQDGFRFSARDIAIKRAQILNIPVILGSATPSLESIHNANQGRYRHLKLPLRPGVARPPSIRVLDIRKQPLTEGLAPGLIRSIKQKLDQHEQILLFINRRGFAPTLICHHCGWVARCRRCDSNLVIHSERKQLRCHHCLSERRIPECCEACASGNLRALGLGTQRVEQLLAKIFPEASIVRIDRDSTRRKGSLDSALDDISTGKTNILIGTQMLAKGHHFPNVTLVGILDSDSGLFSTDFRTTERLAQLMVQVSGRAGRAEKPGTVIIQTRHPDHPLLDSLIKRGYPGFALDALAERKMIGLPPFSYQALIRAEGTDPDHPANFLQNIRQTAEIRDHSGIEILGPVPAPMTKRIGRYRYQLLFQCRHRGVLHGHIEELLPKLAELPGFRRVKWSLDIDPVDLF